ncbi:MAG: hypothetical protein J5736_03305, partial [Bacilli bacterium]|nr:hypothetical protein [Bacilli bacterium]
MKNRGKWLIFPLIVLVVGSAYFGFAKVHSLVVGNLFVGRASTYQALEEKMIYQIRKSWKDYP